MHIVNSELEYFEMIGCQVASQSSGQKVHKVQKLAHAARPYS